MGNRFGLFLGAVGVALLTLWSAFFIVDEREQAIVLRFGEIVRVEKDPGLNFKLPFGFAGLDTVLIIEDRLLRFEVCLCYEVGRTLLLNRKSISPTLQDLSSGLRR